MSIALTTYRPRISVEVPGCPGILVDDALQRAAREFLTRSLLWRRTFRSVASATNIDLGAVLSGSLPTGTRIARVMSVIWVSSASSSHKLTFMATDQLELASAGWANRTSSIPDHYTHESDTPASIRLVPAPASSATLDVRCALTLLPGEVTVPDFVGDEWGETLLHGALSHLFKIPGKDWSNSPLAGMYGSLFGEAINSAKARAAADHGQPVRVVSYGGI